MNRMIYLFSKTLPFFLVFVFFLFLSGCISNDKVASKWNLDKKSEAIIADHRAVQQFDLIPDEWIEKAKELTIHYAHTSHGSQIISGLLVLESMDPKYSIAIRTSASDARLPPVENPPALRIYDGNPPVS